MTHKDIYEKFMIEYDKANITSSYPSLTKYEIATILDKAYLALIAQKVTGNNQRKVSFEADVKAIEDLRPLITSSTITESLEDYKYSNNDFTYAVPDDLLYYVDAKLLRSSIGDYTSLDNKNHYILNINLIDHKYASRFLSTDNNMPWIPVPVLFFDAGVIHVLVDPYKLKDDENDKLKLVYLKRPSKFINSLTSITNTSSSSTTQSESSSQAKITHNIDTIVGVENVTDSTIYTTKAYNSNGIAEDVTWSIESGSEYAVINDGVLTVKDDANNNTVVIKAQSTEDSDVYSTKTIVVSKSEEKTVYTISSITGPTTVSNSDNKATYSVVTNGTPVWSIINNNNAFINANTGVLTVNNSANGSSVRVHVLLKEDSSIYSETIVKCTYVNSEPSTSSYILNSEYYTVELTSYYSGLGTISFSNGDVTKTISGMSYNETTGEYRYYVDKYTVKINKGEKLTMTVTPAKWYHIYKVSDSASTLIDYSVYPKVYTFTVNKDYNITVRFSEDYGFLNTYPIENYVDYIWQYNGFNLKDKTIANREIKYSIFNFEHINDYNSKLQWETPNSYDTNSVYAGSLDTLKNSDGFSISSNGCRLYDDPKDNICKCIEIDANGYQYLTIKAPAGKNIIGIALYMNSDIDENIYPIAGSSDNYIDRTWLSAVNLSGVSTSNSSYYFTTSINDKDGGFDLLLPFDQNTTKLTGTNPNPYIQLKACNEIKLYASNSNTYVPGFIIYYTDTAITDKIYYVSPRHLLYEEGSTIDLSKYSYYIDENCPMNKTISTDYDYYNVYTYYSTNFGGGKNIPTTPIKTLQYGDTSYTIDQSIYFKGMNN